MKPNQKGLTGGRKKLKLWKRCGHTHKLKLRGMNEKLHKKVSPPFEGGVVGTTDYHIYTVFYSRPGWLIH
jgi:hypothetical protein